MWELFPEDRSSEVRDKNTYVDQAAAGVGDTVCKNSLCFHESESITKEKFNSQIIALKVLYLVSRRRYVSKNNRDLANRWRIFLMWKWWLRTKFWGIIREKRCWVGHSNPREAWSRQEHVYLSNKKSWLEQESQVRVMWKKLRKYRSGGSQGITFLCLSLNVLSLS